MTRWLQETGGTRGPEYAARFAAHAAAGKDMHGEARFVLSLLDEVPAGFSTPAAASAGSVHG